MIEVEEPVRVKIDLRCDQNPSRLFARMRLSGERPTYSQPDNLIEIACRDCSKAASAVGPKVRVFHLFNLAGELVRDETELLPVPIQEAMSEPKE